MSLEKLPPYGRLFLAPAKGYSRRERTIVDYTSFGKKGPTFGKSLKNIVLKFRILKILRKPSKQRLGFLKTFKKPSF